MLGDVLQHHDGIVHHHTDGHRQGGQRDDVERTVGEHQVDEGHDQGDRDGDADDQRGAPLAQEEEHDQHHEEEGVQDGFFQGTDGVLDFFRRVVDHLDLDVGRKRLLDAGELLAHVLADLHGVGTRFLGHHQTDGFLAVHLLVEREVLDGIADRRQVADEDFLPKRRGGDHDVGDVGTLLVLAAHLHLVLLAVHLDRTARQVQVVHAHGVGHLLERQVVGVELGLVDVDIDIAVGRTRHRHGADAVDAVELRDHLVVEDLLQAGIAFLRHHGILDDRHQARIELEHHRARATVRQVALDHVYERSDVIGCFVPVCPPLQLDGYYRHVIA